jgi:hypothetical protein
MGVGRPDVGVVVGMAGVGVPVTSACEQAVRVKTRLNRILFIIIVFNLTGWRF